MLAYQKLKDAGFLHEPVRCLACGWNCLGPPVENAASDVLSVYVQCGRRECRTKNNVVSYGVFRGLRLNCCDLLRAIENYCGQTYMCAPHVATMELATSLLANEIPTTSFKLKDLWHRAGKAVRMSCVLMPAFWAFVRGEASLRWKFCHFVLWRKMVFHQLKTRKKSWTVVCCRESRNLASAFCLPMVRLATRMLWRRSKCVFSIEGQFMRKNNGPWKHAPKQGIPKWPAPCASMLSGNPWRSLYTPV